ncbi:hypothetical protein NXV57_11015 [Bacteroides thetaiotaomicron]|nr:hypothetical protein [Bacteroides thetaiotaomicron]
MINRFRVSDAWDINLELRGLLMKDAFGGTSKEGMAGVTVGVTYKFKTRIQRCSYCTDGTGKSVGRHEKQTELSEG